jgi:hypothetical protein
MAGIIMVRFLVERLVVVGFVVVRELLVGQLLVRFLVERFLLVGLVVVGFVVERQLLVGFVVVRFIVERLVVVGCRLGVVVCRRNTGVRERPGTTIAVSSSFWWGRASSTSCVLALPAPDSLIHLLISATDH